LYSKNKRDVVRSLIQIFKIMTREQEFDFIERYFEGQLNAEELQEFERISDNDKQFASRIAQYQQIVDGIKTYHQQDFMQKMDEWDTETSKQKSFRFNPTYLKAAAAVVLLMLPIGIWLYTSSPSHQSLYNKYYQPYPDVISSRSQNNNLPEAMKAYNDADYNQAILFLQEFLNQNESNALGRLYLAESYLATSQLEKARENYLQLQNNSIYQDLSSWRLALINLVEENTDLAKEQLLNIAVQQNHDYRQQAEQLLNELN
jgi:hypothetical protein